MKFNPILTESDFLESVNKYKFIPKKLKVLESEKNEMEYIINSIQPGIEKNNYSFYFGDKYFLSDLKRLESNIKVIESVINKIKTT